MTDGRCNPPPPHAAAVFTLQHSSIVASHRYRDHRHLLLPFRMPHYGFRFIGNYTFVRHFRTILLSLQEGLCNSFKFIIYIVLLFRRVFISLSFSLSCWAYNNMLRVVSSLVYFGRKVIKEEEIR